MLELKYGSDLTYGEFEGIMQCYIEGFNAITVDFSDFKDIAKDYLFSYVYVDSGIVATAMGIERKSLLHGGTPSMRIENVCTLEHYRGRGYGKMVVEHLIENAGNCYKIDLSCSKHNKKFYEKLGFRKHEHTMRIDT